MTYNMDDSNSFLGLFQDTMRNDFDIDEMVDFEQNLEPANNHGIGDNSILNRILQDIPKNGQGNRHQGQSQHSSSEEGDGFPFPSQGYPTNPGGHQMFPNPVPAIINHQGQREHFEAFANPYQMPMHPEIPMPHAVPAIPSYQNQLAHIAAGPVGPAVSNYHTKQEQERNERSVLASSSPHNKKRRSATSDSTASTASEASKKPRRTRKKKIPTKEEEEEKRRLFLERNRKAAKKCRTKNKNWFKDLESQAQRMGEEQERLKHEVAALPRVIQGLKMQLLAHADCGSPLIDKWIQDEGYTIAFSPKSTPTTPNPMARSSSFQIQKERAGRDGKNPRRMARENSSQSQYSYIMSRQASSRSQQGESMSRQGSSASRHSAMTANMSRQNSGLRNEVDSGLSNMGTPEKIKPDSPTSDEGYFGLGLVHSYTPKMANQHIPPSTGNLRGVGMDPTLWLNQNGMPSWQR